MYSDTKWHDIILNRKDAKTANSNLIRLLLDKKIIRFRGYLYLIFPLRFGEGEKVFIQLRKDKGQGTMVSTDISSPTGLRELILVSIQLRIEN